MEKLIVFVLVKYFDYGRVNKLLHQLNLILSFLLKQVFVNTPKVEFHLQHLVIILLLLMHFSVISDEIDHEVKGEGVTIDEVPITLLFQPVSP